MPLGLRDFLHSDHADDLQPTEAAMHITPWASSRAARSSVQSAFLFGSAANGQEAATQVHGSGAARSRRAARPRRYVEWPMAEDGVLPNVSASASSHSRGIRTSALATDASHTPGPRPATAAQFLNVKARTSWTLEVVQALSADPFNVAGWRVRHNYDLDRGMKFGIIHKSPMILDTNLFQPEDFGCFDNERGAEKSVKEAMTGNLMDKLNGDYGKQWWVHPKFTFGAHLGRIHINLTDVTTGEVRWDATYDCQDSPFLFNDDKPIGGQHPFFQPDWCPAAPGNLAHRYRLTIKNEDELPQPGLETIGDIMFTQFGPTQLGRTYAFENAAPPVPA